MEFVTGRSWPLQQASTHFDSESFANTEPRHRRSSTLYQDTAPKFENQLSLEDRKVLQSAADAIRKFVSSEEGALTWAFFKRMPRLDKGADQLLSKILPTQFTDIYIDVFEGYGPTGFPGLSAFEDTKSFPYLDFNVMSSLLAKLGLEARRPRR